MDESFLKMQIKCINSCKYLSNLRNSVETANEKRSECDIPQAFFMVDNNLQRGLFSIRSLPWPTGGWLPESLAHLYALAMLSQCVQSSTTLGNT